MLIHFEGSHRAAKHQKDRDEENRLVYRVRIRWIVGLRDALVGAARTETDELDRGVCE